MDHTGGQVVVEVVNYVPTPENKEVVKEIVNEIIEVNEQPEGSLEMESAEVEQGTEKIDNKTTPTDYEGEVLSAEEVNSENIIKPEESDEIDNKISTLVNLATEKEPEIEQNTEQIKPVIISHHGEEMENTLNTVYNIFKESQPEVLEAVEHSTQIADSILEASLNKIYGLFKEVVTSTERYVTKQLEDIPVTKIQDEENIPTSPTVQTPVEQETQENIDVQDSPLTENSIENDSDVIISTVPTVIEEDVQENQEKEETTEQADDFGVTTEPSEQNNSEQLTESSDTDIIDDEIVDAEESTEHQIVTEPIDYLDASTDESIIHHHETTLQPIIEEKIKDEDIDHFNPKPVEIMEPITGDLIKDEEIDHSNDDPEPTTEQPGIEINDAELAPEVKEFLDTKVDFQDPENFNYKFQFFDDTKIITYVVRPRGLVNILDGEPKYTVYELDAKPVEAIA